MVYLPMLSAVAVPIILPLASFTVTVLPASAVPVTVVPDGFGAVGSLSKFMKDKSSTSLTDKALYLESDELTCPVINENDLGPSKVSSS